MIRRPRWTTRCACGTCATSCTSELEIVMRVYFDKPRTTVGWKGLINDPDLDGSFRIDDGLRITRKLLLRHQRSRSAGRLRIPRHRHSAIRHRPDQLGRDRRAHDGKSGASRARLRPVMSDRLQERHRRQDQDRCRCGESSSPAASFPRGDQGRPFGDRVHHRQRGLPHHPARREVAELRCSARRGGQPRPAASRSRSGRDDRHQPRQLRLQSGQSAERGRRRSRARSRTATTTSRA